MAGFGRKATEQQGNGNSNGGDTDYAAYDVFNKYIFEDCFKAKIVNKGNKKRKQKTVPAVLNYIMDLGTPAGVVNKWQTKCEVPAEGEEYSQEEIDFMKENPKADFIWDREWDDTAKKMADKRKQTSPSQPTQEYGLCIDIPSVLVDYSKHPNAPEGAPEDLRPYRISLNGKFRGDLQKVINFEVNFKSGEVSDKNIIRKIAMASDLDEELKSSGWDIGVMAQAVCNFQVTMDLTETDDGKVFFNTSAAKPSMIEDVEDDEGEIIVTAERKKKKALECEQLAPFTGVLLDMDMEEYTEDLLTMVGNDPYAFVKRAETSQSVNISGVSKAGKDYSFDKGFDYDGCNFQKAYDKWKEKKAKGGSGGKTAEKKEVVKEQPKPQQKPAEKIPEEAPQYNEPPMDFDDD